MRRTFAIAAVAALFVAGVHADSLAIHSFSNPNSPKGSQHCFEVDIPGGRSSPFWAAEGWRYTSPPWSDGACDRSIYSYTNKHIPNLANFTGVDFWSYGKSAEAVEEVAEVVETTEPTATLAIHSFSNPNSPKGSQHCFEVDIPGGRSSPFWAAEGWRYTSPPWSDGACDRSIYSYTNKHIPNLANFTGVDFWSYGKSAEAVEEVAEDVETPEPTATLAIHSFSNPNSPKGSQHCFEVDIPGGRSSPFWAAEGWRYTSPPWSDGACDRSIYSYTNKHIPNLANFTGVDFWSYGKSQEEVDMSAEETMGPIHASCRLQWTFASSSCADAVSGISGAIKSMTGLANCGSGEKCGYIPGTQNATAITAKHETPSHHYLDDISISFQASGSGCKAQGYSTSETWYAVLDYGTNYCNLHNLAVASGVSFTEDVSDAECTQYSSANCDKY